MTLELVRGVACILLDVTHPWHVLVPKVAKVLLPKS